MSSCESPAMEATAVSPDKDEEEEESDDDVEPLAVRKIKMIISGTCQICKVAPLCNIKNDVPSLKKYEKTLDSALAHHADQIDTTGGKMFITRCFFLPLNPDESEGEFMFIEIFEQQGSQRETRTACFMAMLFGYGSSKTSVKHFSQRKNFKNLPSFIYNGRSKYWKILEPALESLFSCNFKATDLSQSVIKSVAAAWILESIRTAQRNNKLRITHADMLGYNSFGAKLETIVVFTPFIRKWKRYLNDPNSIGEAIHMIWSDIRKELMTTNKINFAKAAIFKISSNSFVLTSDGRFKLALENTDMILSILAQVTQALERVRA